MLSVSTIAVTLILAVAFFAVSNHPSQGVKVAFVKYENNPVFKPTEAWENGVIGEHSVIYDDAEQTFKMWYRGNYGADGALGYATSSDGIRWDRHSLSPILEVNGGAEFPFVLKESKNLYYLFQAKAFDNSLYRWSSTNGIDWRIDNDDNPILKPSTSGWDDIFICNVAIYHNDTITPSWNMLYEAKGTGSNGAFMIGYAWSNDGLGWTKYSGNPVLPRACGIKECGNPSEILNLNNRYYVWFGGYVDGKMKVYSSSSSDFVNWSNPTLAISNGVSWEGDHVGDPSIALYSEKYYLYYSGNQSEIGLAIQIK